jgi:uncharacterized protein YecE (DUF72 family)
MYERPIATRMNHLATERLASIHIGIGGWTYDPWRGGGFFPPKLPRSKELHYASRQVSAIEVNGTYYSTFTPATFAKWRDETPEGFVFSLKAHLATTNRKDLGTGREAIARFLASGITELGTRLGPIVWQLMPTKQFDATEFEAFLSLLPRMHDGVPLRHALEVRHPSFASPDYLPLARRYGCATVHVDSPEYPNIADAQGPFAYVRLLRCQADVATGYPPRALDEWAAGARAWAGGSAPRDAFIFFINGAKERAPAAAMELIRRTRPNS